LKSATFELSNLHDLDLDLGSGYTVHHTVTYHSSTCTYIPKISFTSEEISVDGWTDGH